MSWNPFDVFFDPPTGPYRDGILDQMNQASKAANAHKERMAKIAADKQVPLYTIAAIVCQADLTDAQKIKSIQAILLELKYLKYNTEIKE